MNRLILWHYVWKDDVSSMVDHIHTMIMLLHIYIYGITYMLFLLVLHVIYPSLLTHFHQRLAHKDIGHVWHRPQFFHHLPSPRFRHLWISRVETSQVDQSGNFKAIHPPQLLEAVTFLTCLGWIPWYFNIFHLNPNRRKTILTQHRKKIDQTCY